MKCDKCDKIATVHITDIVNGKKKEMHLCDECGRQLSEKIDTTISMPGLLGKLAQAVPLQQEKGEEVACPDCNITYSEFRKTGRLGCAEDYRVFEGMLLPILERLHGGTQHVGKKPSRASRGADVENQLTQLRRDLTDAVKKEDYERAAAIRDQIRRVETGEVAS